MSVATRSMTTEVAIDVPGLAWYIVEKGVKARPTYENSN